MVSLEYFHLTWYFIFRKWSYASFSSRTKLSPDFSTLWCVIHGKLLHFKPLQQPLHVEILLDEKLCLRSFEFFRKRLYELEANELKQKFSFASLEINIISVLPVKVFCTCLPFQYLRVRWPDPQV